MNLNFSFSEADDNSSVVVTDTTPDWGVGQIAQIYANRADGSTKAQLTLTILGIEYDPIDVIDYFQGGTQEDLEFEITADMLKVDGVSDFLETDAFPDGDVVIKYDVVDLQGAQSDSFSDTYFVYGVIEQEVLVKLLETNTQALTCSSSLHKANVRLIHFSYLMAMINSANSGQITNLRTMLERLQYMVTNNTF